MTNDRERLVHFRVGRGVGLIAGTTVALLDEQNGEMADRLWLAASSGGGADVILEELSATGLRTLGSFVVAEHEAGGIRFVVRGEGIATVEGERDRVEIDSGETRTWTEVVVNDATGFTLRIGSDEPTSDLPFRLSSGVAPADLVAWGTAVGSSVLAGLDLDWVDRFEPSHVAVESETEPDRSDSQPEGSDLEPIVSKGVPTSVADSSNRGEWFLSNTDEQVEIGKAPDSFEPILDPPADEGAAVPVDEIVHSVDTILPGGLHAPPPDASDLNETPSQAEDDGLEYDALFGETTFKSVDRAAVVFEEESDTDADDAARSEMPDPAPAEPGRQGEGLAQVEPRASGLIDAIPPGVSSAPQASAVAPPGGDHDGHTMSIAQLRALRGQSPAPPVVLGQPPMGGETVQALLCTSGHPSPPQAVSCRTCGVPISGTSVVIGRPRLGRLVVSSGEVIELDRSTILGRRPQAEGVLHGQVPQLVALGDTPGLSRSHAMIRLEQWQVLIEDLGSANGTIVTLPGRDPRRLHEADPMLLEHGAVIDLGGEVLVTVDLGV